MRYKHKAMVGSAESRVFITEMGAKLSRTNNFCRCTYVQQIVYTIMSMIKLPTKRCVFGCNLMWLKFSNPPKPEACFGETVRAKTGVRN